MLKMSSEVPCPAPTIPQRLPHREVAIPQRSPSLPQRSPSLGGRYTPEVALSCRRSLAPRSLAPRSLAPNLKPRRSPQQTAPGGYPLLNSQAVCDNIQPTYPVPLHFSFGARPLRCFSQMFNHLQNISAKSPTLINP